MSRRLLAVALLCAAGCADRDGAEDTGHAEDPRYGLATYGQAPWDPIRASVDPHGPPDGEVAALVDGAVLDEALFTPNRGVYAWRASDGLAPGVHTITHPDDPTQEIAHEVLPYGREESFDPLSIVGQRYVLDPDDLWVASPEGIGDLLADYLTGVWLTVLEIDGSEVLFEVHTQADGDYPICRALRARGTLTETGELSWAEPELDIETEQGQAPLTDLFIHGGWLADGSQLGGAEGGGTLHTALMSQHLFASDTGLAPDDYMCALLAGFGVSCYDCQGDGQFCVDIRLHAGVLVPDEGDFPADPPDCGLDLEEGAIGPIQCTMPDFSCAASFVGLLGLTGLLRRRSLTPTADRRLRSR